MHVMTFLSSLCFLLSTIVSTTLIARRLVHSGKINNLFRTANLVTTGGTQNHFLKIELLKWDMLVGF